MLNFLRKNIEILAPVTGEVMDLAEVSDEVFAKKLAGEGVAIKATGSKILAPVDGKLTLIFPYNHAFVITTDNGVEVLVHIGLDTIQMQGEGFKRIAVEGSYVKAGEPVIMIDRDYLIAKECCLITPVIITNPDRIKELYFNIDKDVIAGEESVIRCKTK